LSIATPLERIVVGVVVERRKAANPWVDFVWQPIGVLTGEPDAAPWTVLGTSEDRTRYYAGSVEIGLYRTEAGYYRENITSRAPSLWVALRPTGVEPPYEIVAVTADPAEGESFTQVGDDVVEAVPMPPAVREIIEAFVAAHFVERPFEKRKRDRADPEALARRAPVEEDRRE
jgi:hypothetical protein